jgi:hypothetical protein
MRSAWTLMAIVATSGCTTVENHYYGVTPDASIDSGSDGAPATGADDTMSCGHPLPMTAPATIRVTGIVSAVDPSAPSGLLAGAIVELHRRGGTGPLATMTSAADGSYTLVAQSGGVPIDAFLRIHKTGFVDTFSYFALPLAADTTGRGEPVLTMAQLDAMRASSMVPAMPGRALVVARVIDCANQPLDGATLTIDPVAGATVFYPTGGGVNATETTSDGLAAVDNVPPGELRVDGSRESLGLRGHTIDVRAGAVTLVDLSP